jgi:hypothetical protein
MRKRLTVIFMTAALITSMPLAALAHECINANRSETGSQNAAHGAWFYISEAEVIGFVAGALGLTPEQVDEVDDAFFAELRAQKLPTSFSVFIGKLTIGTNPTTHEVVAAYQDSDKSADGNGIDHLDALGTRYVGIMQSLLS